MSAITAATTATMTATPNLRGSVAMALELEDHHHGNRIRILENVATAEQQQQKEHAYDSEYANPNNGQEIIEPEHKHNDNHEATEAEYQNVANKLDQSVSQLKETLATKGEHLVIDNDTGKALLEPLPLLLVEEEAEEDVVVLLAKEPTLDEANAELDFDVDADADELEKQAEANMFVEELLAEEAQDAEAFEQEFDKAIMGEAVEDEDDDDDPMDEGDNIEIANTNNLTTDEQSLEEGEELKEEHQHEAEMEMEEEIEQEGVALYRNPTSTLSNLNLNDLDQENLDKQESGEQELEQKLLEEIDIDQTTGGQLLELGPGEEIILQEGPDGKLQSMIVLDEDGHEVEHVEVENMEELVEEAADEWEKEHKNKKDNDVEFTFGTNGELDKVLDVLEYLGREGEIEHDVDESEQVQKPLDVEELLEEVQVTLYQEAKTAIEEEGDGSQEEDDVDVDHGNEAEEEMLLDGEENENENEYYKTLTTAMTTEEEEQEEDFKELMGEEEFIKEMALEEEEEEQEWEQEYLNEEQEEWEQESYYDYNTNNDIGIDNNDNDTEYDDAQEDDYEYVNVGDKDDGAPSTLDEYGVPIDSVLSSTSETEDQKISQDWNNDPILNQESEIEVPGDTGSSVAAPYYANLDNEMTGTIGSVSGDVPVAMEKAETPIINVVDGKIVGGNHDYDNMNSGSIVLLLAIVGVLLSFMVFVRSRRDGESDGGPPASSTLPNRRTSADGGAGAAGYELVNPGQTYHSH
jgi:hypothetical protein